MCTHAGLVGMNRKRKATDEDLLLNDGTDDETDPDVAIPSGNGGTGAALRLAQRKKAKIGAEFADDDSDGERAPSEDEAEEDPHAHETADETRIRLAKEYIARVARDKAALVCSCACARRCLSVDLMVARRVWMKKAKATVKATRAKSVTL